MAQITIPLYYDLDLLLWTSAAGGIARQPNLVLGQSDSIAFAVQFVRSGVVIELTSPAWICGIKPINDVAGDYLCQTTTGVKTGSTTTTVYTFTLLLDSTELRAWLLTVTAVSNYAAFSIRDTVNLIATLPAITCTILPDYTLEGTTPTDASGTLIVDSGQTFTVHKTFAMPVDDGFNNYVLKTDGAGVGSWAVDSAGTGTVTSVAQSFTGGIIQVNGSPVTTSGTLALTVSGTAGGIVYFSSNSVWGSTGSLSAGGLIVGGGTSIPTVLAAVASGRVLTSAGTLTTPAYSSTITLGASGTLGTITLGNATSGTILITPPTGALGTVTLTLPITSTTLAGLAVTQTFTQVNTFSSSTASTSTASGAVVITGGLGVGGNAYVGGVINLPATTSTAGKITQAGNNLLHTFGTDSIYLGKDAGNTSNTSVASVGVGTRSLYSLSDGRQNLCFGFQSGYYITTGWDNTVFGGYNTGLGIVDGGANTIIGAGANISTDGNYRGAIGAYSSCSADDTIVIGKIAGTYKVNNVAGSRSADAVIIRGTTTCTGGVIFGTYTVSNFPQTTYLEAVVTDALSPVVGSTVNAGGSAKCKVMYNGSAKIVTAVL